MLLGNDAGAGAPLPSLSKLLLLLCFPPFISSIFQNGLDLSFSLRPLEGTPARSGVPPVGGVPPFEEAPPLAPPFIRLGGGAASDGAFGVCSLSPFDLRADAGGGPGGGGGARGNTSAAARSNTLGE